MFEKTEIKKPNFTIRMLLNHIHSAKAGDKPSLKAFTHFTLACTHNNEASIGDKLMDLATYLKEPLSLNAEKVINLGSEISPLWGVRLNLGANETAFRNKLSVLFDDLMCHEMNGVRYLWNPTSATEMKCPHITIGSKPEDRNTAQKLVDDAYTFTFERMDYKKIGPNDPHVTIDLAVQNEFPAVKIK
jgi:hypothetical protein